MSHPTIITLPDLPLLNILKRLPLYDLVYGARQMCVRMRAIVQIELAHRRSLVLTHGGDRNESLNSLREDKPHCGQLLQHVQREDGSRMVRLPTLAQYKFNFVPLSTAVRGSALMNALSGITHLTVSYSNLSPKFLSRIIRMLNHWSDSLLSLTFYLKEMRQFSPHNSLQVFEEINRLNSLRHLKISLPFTHYIVDGRMGLIHPTPNLQFVSRLVTLCVESGIEPEVFFDALAQYGTANGNLRQVCFHVDVSVDTYFFEMLQFGLDQPRLANCFTSLSIDVFRDSWWSEQRVLQMEHLCTRFSLLTTLQLEMEPSAMAGLAQQFRRLQHLVTLKLYICRCGVDGDDDEPGFAQGWPILDQNRPPPDGDHLVYSVRVLQLSLATVSHQNLAAIQIAHYFPNLQALHVEQFHGECYSCTPPVNQLDFTIYRCLPRALQPFRVCAHLRTIEYNPGLAFELRRITPQQLPLNLD